MACQRGVKRRAEAVNIGERRDCASISLGLLRSHIRGRSHHSARQRPLCVFSEPARESEIGDVRLALGVDQNVGGFQVAVEDVALVGMVDCPGRQGDDFRPLRGVGDVAAQELIEALAFNQRHAEVIEPLIISRFMEFHDIGVVQIRGRLRLVTESPHLLRRGKISGSNHLQGHQPVEAPLPRLVDNAHSSFAEDL